MPKKISLVTTAIISGNLASWKNHAIELHDFLLEAGLEWVDDIGEQIDISAWTGTMAPNTNVGYRIYKINDDLSALGYNIFIRLDFGFCNEGLVSSTGNPTNVLRVTITVGDNVLPDGTCRCGDAESIIKSAYPNNNNGGGSGSVTAQPGSPKIYNFNPERGMYYLVFNLDGRGVITNGGVNTCTLAFLIQRTLDASGNPTNEGFCCYLSNFSSYVGGSLTSYRFPNNSSSTSWYNLVGGYVYETQTQRQSNRIIQHAGGDINVYDGKIPIMPTFIFTDKLTYNPNLVLYNGFHMTPGTIFQNEIAPGVVSNFLALGPGTGIMFGEFGNQTHLAINWD